MVDRIKFYLENIIISEAVLGRIFTKRFKKKGTQYYIADYNQMSFMSELTPEDFQEAPKVTVLIKSLEKENYKNYKNLFICYAVKEGKSGGRLTIHQNIRKDFISYKKESAFKDLNYLDFIEIINLYADEFEIPRNIFWKAKITQIELGVNLRFNITMSSILSSISQMNGTSETIRVVNSAVTFRNKKYELSIYNKLSRASQQNEVFRGRNKISKKKMIKKISRRHSFVRFELRVRSMSQFNRRGFTNKLNSLSLLRDNFAEVGAEVYGLLSQISFVNTISPEIDKGLIESQMRGKSVKNFDKYLKYLGLKSFGVRGVSSISRFIDFATPLLNTNIKRSYLTKCEQLFNEYKKNNDYVKLTFSRKLHKKISELTGGSLLSDSI